MKLLYIFIIIYKKVFYKKEIKRTSFEKDSTGEHAELFLKEGGFCYIRVKDDYIHLGWFRGRHIEDKYEKNKKLS